MEGCSRCRSRFPLLEKYERKIQRVSLEKKGVRRGNVRTGNPDSASRVSSGTFLGVLRWNDNIGFETESVDSVENCGVPVFADASVVGDGDAYHGCGEESK